MDGISNVSEGMDRDDRQASRGREQSEREQSGKQSLVPRPPQRMRKVTTSHNGEQREGDERALTARAPLVLLLL